MSKIKTKRFKNGGDFFNEVLQPTGQMFANLGRADADIALSAFGLNNVIKDDAYKGNNADFFRGTANVLGGVNKALLPTAMNIAAPGSGAIAAGAQQGIGSLNPQTMKQGGLINFKGGNGQTDSIEIAPNVFVNNGETAVKTPQGNLVINSNSDKVKMLLDGKDPSQMSKKIDKIASFRKNDLLSDNYRNKNLSRLSEISSHIGSLINPSASNFKDESHSENYVGGGSTSLTRNANFATGGKYDVPTYGTYLTQETPFDINGIQQDNFPSGKYTANGQNANDLRTNNDNWNRQGDNPDNPWGDNDSTMVIPAYGIDKVGIRNPLKNFNPNSANPGAYTDTIIRNQNNPDFVDPITRATIAGTDATDKTKQAYENKKLSEQAEAAKYNDPVYSNDKVNATSNNNDYSKYLPYATLAAGALAKSLPELQELSRLKKTPVQVTSYNRVKYNPVTANYLDPRAALKNASQENRTNDYNIKNVTAGNLGSYLSNMSANRLGTAKAKTDINFAYDNQNKGIANQIAQFNAGNELNTSDRNATIGNMEIDANQQAAANKQNQMYKLRQGLGDNASSALSTANQQYFGDKFDNKTNNQNIQLMSDLFKNPEFLAMVKNYIK